MRARPELVAFALTALSMVCASVLAGLGHAVPSELWTLGYGGLVAGAGVTIPRSAIGAAS